MTTSRATWRYRTHRLRDRGTPFQQQVWNALRWLSAWDDVELWALATRIGNAAAVRAVGLANGANPIASSCRATSHRHRWIADGIRRRAGAQALAACA